MAGFYSAYSSVQFFLLHPKPFSLFPNGGRTDRLLYNQDMDKIERDQLIKDHMPFARKIASWFNSSFFNRDDFVSIAYIGLVEAANRYNPTLGPFEAFAFRRINGAILDEMISSTTRGRKAPDPYGATLLFRDKLRREEDVEEKNRTDVIEIREILSIILEKEKEMDKHIIYLIYFEELSLKDVAKVFGLSEPAICLRRQKIFERARKRFAFLAHG